MHRIPATHPVHQQVCEAGDLFGLIREVAAEGSHFSEEYIWIMFAQIVSAIQYCHQPEIRSGASSDNRIIIHRDLKPENSESSPLNIQLSRTRNEQ